MQQMAYDMSGAMKQDATTFFYERERYYKEQGYSNKEAGDKAEVETIQKFNLYS
jgi:hypothetical protein